MGDEGIDISKVVVRVLIVLGLIAAIYGLYSLLSSRLSGGVNKLSENLSSMDSSTYASYDDAIVTGTEVLTALKTFRDADFAVVICNNDATLTGSALQSGSAGSGFNYCGLLTSSVDQGSAQAVTLTASGGKITYASGLQWNTSTGKAARCTNFSPTTQTSDKSHYVQQKAKWYSKLIYDSNDQVIGVVFAQFR